MTISYTASVATCKYFGCFWKLLFRWKASIYKLLWPNMLLFLSSYFTISLIYRFILDTNQRQIFEEIALFCEINRDMIPVSFVLGFYVSIVVKRWWDQYQAIPWPDPFAVLVSVHITGADVKSRLMRRTIMRYVNLALVMTFRLICPPVKKKYPTMKHLVDSGFLLINELEVLNKLEAKSLHPKYWVPIVWAAGILSKARREKIIKDDMGFKSLIEELNRFRQGCLNLFSYDWISIPLVYTQVVTLAVYSYFLASLMASQYLDPQKGYPKNSIDLYFPYFAMLQFFFFMGWLLVAESLVNPFGENDDDIEVIWLIDRNLQVSYLIVDEVHEEHPKLLKDPYWDDVFPPDPPSTRYKQNEPYLGSTWEMPMSQYDYLNKSSILRSRINPFFASKVMQTKMSRAANYEASSRKVSEKESTVILKSIQNKLVRERFVMDLGNTESVLPNEEIKLLPNNPKSQIDFDNNDLQSLVENLTTVNNVNLMSEPVIKEYPNQHNKLINQDTPPHSWHGFTYKESNSESTKLGKIIENYDPVSKSIQFELQTGFGRVQQESRSIDKSIEGRIHLEQLDRSQARCSHYANPNDAAAPSTTLYTINEEKDQIITNSSDPGVE